MEYNDIKARIIERDVYQPATALYDFLRLSDDLLSEDRDELAMDTTPYELVVQGLILDCDGEVLDEIADEVWIHHTCNTTRMIADMSASYMKRTALMDTCTDLVRDGRTTWKEIAERIDASADGKTMEIIQYWLISDWLADQLQSNDELVARDVQGVNFWGRVYDGSLTDDPAIQKIAWQIHQQMRGAA